MVTVILTVFKRACNLEKQINALLSQTIPPTDFIININDTKDRNIYDPIIKKLIPNALIVEHSKNLGVWSRFFLWFNANTDYVFIIDDDNIPGNKWIENWIEVLKNEECIIWSWGSIFNSLKVRRDRQIISETTNRPNKLTFVNMSGHSWLFRKETLPKMLSNLPDLVKFKVCGEELVVSWNASKVGIKTYILPMTDDKETWGDKEPTLWHDRNAGFNIYGNNLYQEFYDYCIWQWYNPIEDYKKLNS